MLELSMQMGHKQANIATHNYALPKYAVAWRFDEENKTFYQMWPMRFDSPSQASDWIKREYPLSPQWNISWVILEVA